MSRDPALAERLHNAIEAERAATFAHLATVANRKLNPQYREAYMRARNVTDALIEQVAAP